MSGHGKALFAEPDMNPEAVRNWNFGLEYATPQCVAQFFANRLTLREAEVEWVKRFACDPPHGPGSTDPA